MNEKTKEKIRIFLRYIITIIEVLRRKLALFICSIIQLSTIIKKSTRYILNTSAINTVLVILTAGLIISTYYSIEATKAATNATISIKNVELRLLYLSAKEAVREKINIGNSLSTELSSPNKDILGFIALDFLNEDNPSEGYEHRLKTEQLERAINTPGFGTNELREQLVWVQTDLELINRHLDEISYAIRKENSKIRIERIRAARNIARDLLKGYGNVWAYDKLEKELRAYIKSQEETLTKLDNQLLKELTG